MKRIALALLLAFAPGCAVVSYLPTVIAAVTDAVMVVDAIERFVALYFAKKPDAEKAEKVAVAIARTRAALHFALRAAEGAEKLDQAQIDAAFAAFKDAYQALIALVEPLGVQADGPEMRAGPDLLIVPEPLALTLKAAK